MTNDERIQHRIARDKYRRALKKAEKNKQYSEINSVFTMQHYMVALKKCNSGVSWKSSVQKYNQHAVTEMSEALENIYNGKLPKLHNTKKIRIYERGKAREIIPITISDRMTQRIICDYSLLPVLRRTLIYDNGASLKNKGVNFARTRINHHLQQAIREYGTIFYAFLFDFKGFFKNILHKTCWNILDVNYCCPDMKNFNMEIIKSYQYAEISRVCDTRVRESLLAQLKNNQAKGICLGSQISQIMAVAVPNKLDHFIKDVCGIKHYIRYADDGIILSSDKHFLKDLYNKMKIICAELGLIFNEKKTKITKVSKGFVFLKIKYRVLPNGRILKTLTRAGIVRMRRKLKKFRQLVDSGRMTLNDVYQSIQSWLSNSKKAMSYHTRKSMLKLYNALFDGYRITKKWRRERGELYEILQAYKWDEFRWHWNDKRPATIPA